MPFTQHKNIKTFSSLAPIGSCHKVAVEVLLILTGCVLGV